jgi:hypothetical protein
MTLFAPFCCRADGKKLFLKKSQKMARRQKKQPKFFFSRRNTSFFNRAEIF